MSIDTTSVELSAELLELRELLAEHVHDTWAKNRRAEGWTLGPRRDDGLRQHPGLIPYADLPESEKEYDRLTAQETLKVILALGFQIRKKD